MRSKTVTGLSIFNTAEHINEQMPIGENLKRHQKNLPLTICNLFNKLIFTS